jgi:hypothetical protein
LVETELAAETLKRRNGMDIDSGIEASQKKKTDIIYQSLIRMGWERICPASFMAFNSTGWSSYGHRESLGHLHTV